MRNYGLQFQTDAEGYINEALPMAESGINALETFCKAHVRKQRWMDLAYLLRDISALAACHYALENKAGFENALEVSVRYSSFLFPDGVVSAGIYTWDLTFSLIRWDSDAVVRIAKRIEREKNEREKNEDEKASSHGLIARCLAALTMGQSNIAQVCAAELAKMCREKGYDREGCEHSAPIAEAAEAVVTQDSTLLQKAAKTREKVERSCIDNQIKRSMNDSPSILYPQHFWDIPMTALLLIAHKSGLSVPTSPFFDISWWVQAKAA